jgi:hypothetical protein
MMAFATGGKITVAGFGTENASTTVAAAMTEMIIIEAEMRQ